MSIVICVPWVKPIPQFMSEFPDWYADNKKAYDLKLHWKMWRPLHEVQAGAVKLAREIGASHIMFTEDDHWHFPIDGLEHLLAADKDVIGYPSYFKMFPFYSLVMRKKDPQKSLLADEKNLMPISQAAGPVVQEVDVITWAFTLVKAGVFERLAGDPFAFTGNPPTDSQFCELCDHAGIPRHVHFGAMIRHGDVEPEMIPHMRKMYAEMLAQMKYGAVAEADVQGRNALKIQMEAMTA